MQMYSGCRVAPLQIALGIISSTTVILVWGMIRMGFGAFGIGLSFIISYTLLTIARVAYARYTIKLSIRYWMKRVAMPVISTMVLSFSAGYAVAYICPQSFLRIFLTTSTTIGVIIFSTWCMGCDEDEKSYFLSAFRKLQNRIKRGKIAC